MQVRDCKILSKGKDGRGELEGVLSEPVYNISHISFLSFLEVKHL